MQTQINENILKYQFYSTVIADILKAIEGGSFGGAFILSFCCIDYMGNPLAQGAGKAKNDKNDYKNFITDYLSEVNSKYSNLTEQLYAIRCSLVHTYGESDATRTLEIIPQFLFGDLLSNHLWFDTAENKLHISLSDFISDLILAIHLFFMRISKAKIDWLPKLYYPQNIKAFLDIQRIKNGHPIVYKSIHPFLEIFDKENDTTHIRTTIKNIIEEEIERHKR
jgi:hypothetical protein